MVLSDYFPKLVNDAVDDSAKPINKTWNHGFITRILDPQTLYTVVTTTTSSILKHLLTEGDKIFLSISSTSYNQVTLPTNV